MERAEERKCWWKYTGIEPRAKNENNPRYIRVKNAVSGNYGMTNDGFRGMGIQKNKRYDFSVWAKPVNNAKVDCVLNW
jgi:hypothetical protein